MYIGQHWSMDYGFTGGSAYKSISESGHTIFSIDGYNSYLLIIEPFSLGIFFFSKNTACGYCKTSSRQVYISTPTQDRVNRPRR